jgi:hypothetical protein
MDSLQPFIVDKSKYIWTTIIAGQYPFANWGLRKNYEYPEDIVYTPKSPRGKKCLNDLKN